MAASAIARGWKAAITLLAATSPQRVPTGPPSIRVPQELANITTDAGAGPFKPSLEIQPPPYANVRGEPCVVPLGRHEFRHSWGRPYTAKFPPATACDPANSVAYLRWDATSPLGTQFDRIAAVWVNGVELLRTSTQEPDRRTGVSWSVVKDVSDYYDVLRRGGDVVIALDNVIEGKYNSSFNVSLQAEFYRPRGLGADPKPSRPDLILPVSKNTTTDYGWFRVEPATANVSSASVLVPRNTEELYLELFLSHHQCDEFHYGNPPSDFAKTIGSCGGGPFREVQVLLDGHLVGVVWPFPLIFTGGLNPYLWRPVVAIGAFQAPTYIVHLTPFLQHLVDGQRHTITFAVDHGIDVWPIDGNLLVYVDKRGTQTRAELLTGPAITPASVTPTETRSVVGLNGNFTFTAQREVRVRSRVTTSKGTKIYDLHQRLGYANTQTFTDDGQVGTFDARTTSRTELRVSSPIFGPQSGLEWPLLRYTQEDTYPLRGWTYFKQLPEQNFRLEAKIANAWQRQSSWEPLSWPSPPLRFGGWRSRDVRVALEGAAEMQSGVGGNGTTRATYRERHPEDGTCYQRAVRADHGELVEDTSSTTWCGP